MDKFTLVQKIFLYTAILIFMIFILLPFVEMFYASLRPLDHLFRSPYQFYSDDLSFCCLLYTSPSPRDATLSRMPSSA